MKKGLILGFTALFITALSTSCEKKYEDGPVVSLSTKQDRMVNTWIFSYAEEDGENVSEDYDQYELYMNESNEAELKAEYRSFGIIYNAETSGTWSFTNESENLLLNFDNDDFDNEYRILRLMKNELWLEDTDQNLELHLLSK
ncbi:MAG: hypothetical protein ABJG68_06190 [Crocinitomicaceae bacterium]